MKVKLCTRKGYCELIREASDPRFSGAANAAGESRLLHHLKLELNSRGLDLVKKRMWKDGHLVGDMQQYLRTRSKRSRRPHICIYNSQWQIEGAEERFNATGRVRLTVVADIFEKDQQ